MKNYLKYKKILAFLSSLAVFFTTYFLILPAITLESEKVGTGTDNNLGIVLESLLEEPNKAEETGENALTESLPQNPSEESLALEPQPEESQVLESLPQESLTEEEAKKKTKENLSLITEKTVLAYQGSNYTVYAGFGASAKFPKGIELKAEEISSSHADYAMYKGMVDGMFQGGGNAVSFLQLFDIHFEYEGEEYQPQGNVRIKIEYDYGPRAEDSDGFQIIHFIEGTQAEVLENELTSTEKLEDVSIVTNHFSTYALARSTNTAEVTVDGKTYYTLSFNYLDDTGASKTSNVLVEKKTGAKVGTLPQDPYVTGKKFVEWRISGTTTKVDANTAVTGNMQIDAYFENVNVWKVSLNQVYYNRQQGRNVTFNTITLDVREEELPKTLADILPASVKVNRSMDNTLTTEQEYFPASQTVELTRNALVAKDTDNDKVVSFDYQYKPKETRYYIYYRLRNKDQSNSVELGRVAAYGSVDDVITIDGNKIPDQFKTQLANAEFERADSGTLYDVDQTYNVYYTRKRVLLSYATGEGSYIPAEELNSGDTKDLNNVVPTRAGYVFDGWYTNANYTGSPVTSIKVDTDTRLYAKWREANTTYSVVYLKEVYNADGLATTHQIHEVKPSVSGVTGTSVNGAQQTAPATALPFYYELDTTRNSQNNVTVAADGSTVVNVYYKLKSYNIEFFVNTASGLNSNTTRYAYIEIGGTNYAGRTYKIEGVKVGQKIQDVWPSAPNTEIKINNNRQLNNRDPYVPLTFNRWIDPTGKSPSLKTDRIYLTEDILAGVNAQTNTQVFHADYMTNVGREVTINYYFQSPTNSTTYPLGTSEKVATTAKGTFSCKAFPGYTNNDRKSTGTASTTATTVNCYYDLDKYTMTYKYNSKEQTSVTTVGTKENILQGTNINTAIYNYQPVRPADVDSDYTWGGWYKDATFTTPFFPSNTESMPIQGNQELYAKWVAPRYRVTFDLQGGSSTYNYSYTLEKGSLGMVPNEKPTKQYYDFVGWYDAPTGGNLFDPNARVMGNKTVYAQWRQKPLQYTVQYVEQGTNRVLATEKVMKGTAYQQGQQVTEPSIAISGYRPTETEKTIALQLNPDSNVITFTYVPKTATSYTVKYVLDSNPNIKVRADKVVNVSGDVIEVVELAQPVDDAFFARQTGVTSEMALKSYYPRVQNQKLPISATAANNVLTFRYVDYNTTIVDIQYLHMDNTAIPGQNAEQLALTKPNTLQTADKQKNIPGYTYVEVVDGQNVKNKGMYQIEGNGTRIALKYYYKKNIVLTPKAKNKVYDGTALTSSGVNDVDISANSLLTGHRVSNITYSGTITNAGTASTSIASVTIVDAQGVDKTHLYQIQKGTNTLTVRPKPVTVTITGEQKEVEYDGNTHQAGWTITKSDASYPDENIVEGTINRNAQKNAGPYTVNLQNKFTNNNPNYAVSFVASNGRLLITPKAVTLTSESASVAYDGTAKKHNVVQATGFVTGEGMTATTTATRTLPGKTVNDFTYTLNANTLARNYTITKVTGHLEVLPTVNLQKTDSTWNALEDARFELYRLDTNGVYASVQNYNDFQVGTNGYNLKGLPLGSYRLKEIQAPDGYIVLNKYIYFDLVEKADHSGDYDLVLATGNDGIELTDMRIQEGAADYSHRLQAVNQAGASLPNTGGEGASRYTLLGVLCLMLVVTIYAFKQKSKAEEA